MARDLPDELWSYNLRRSAKLSEEQRKLMHTWDSGPKDSRKVQELLLRLDRTDSLVASQLATGPDYKNVNLVQTQNRTDSPSSSSSNTQNYVGYDTTTAPAHANMPD